MAGRRTSLLKLLRSIIRNPPYLEMGKVYQTYLSSDRVYTCTTCHTHLARHEDIISKAFQGRHGRAYLFNEVCPGGPPAHDRPAFRRRHLLQRMPDYSGVEIRLRLRGVPEVQGRQVHRREGQDVQRELLGGRRWGGDGRAMSDVDAGEMIGSMRGRLARVGNELGFDGRDGKVT
ncbi:hypothetical protein BC938DRAFT_483003 [Jimgerdemannia flammicorona]|uniref:Yippee domain-containing protein n=1 Tax=Jimgerdemannia flammicorona TaxID=994334 RepID=A0A433QCT9_9FUNG|nr:hypothetical protein BC938DRAFT_483003 [Jimgerdemannia flammicorona]